jgi:hypothetical protein
MQRSSMTRRGFLRGLALGAGTSLLAACGASPPASPSGEASTAAPAAPAVASGSTTLL